MGTMKKTEKIQLVEPLSMSPSGGGYVPARNLNKRDLGGVIFGCKNNTMGECLTKKLFGLPSASFHYVRNIEPGLTLFLFNYSDRKMHGIYEAATPGQMNIDPYAWTNDGKERTGFPAQVRINFRTQCQPVAENQFKKVIGDSYYKAENENTARSDPGNAELVQIVKELKERAAALEKKQFESELEMQQLRNVVKDSGAQIRQLKNCVNELESKLMRSVGSENVIYLIGGFNGKSWLSALNSFAPSTDILMPLKSMGSVRAYASAAALDGNLFVFGGGDGSSWFDTVECYSPRNDNWTLCSPLIRAKGSLAGATLNGKIFALGGGNGSDTFADVEMFDPALGKWIYNQSMLQKRFAPAAAELGDVLYATGGYDGQDYLQTAERLDPRVGYWTKLSNMKTRRGSHSMAVLNEKLYVMGGFDGKGMVSSVEIFEPRNGSWLEGEPLNLVRGYGAAAVLGGSLFVIGGVDNKNDIVESVECYREGAGWTSCTHKAIGKRCFFSAVVP